MGKFPWLCARLCRCVQLSPDAGGVLHHLNRSPAGLGLPHRNFLTLGLRNPCATFPFHPCCIGHTCISLPRTCPLLLKTPIGLANFLQKVKANPLPCPVSLANKSTSEFPCGCCFQIGVWGNRKGHFETRRNPSSQSFCSYLSWSQPSTSEKLKLYLGQRHL